MPFASTSLGAEQPLLNSELLGYGRDPLAPIKDAVTADGDVVVPLDAEAFGFWLKAAFGAPTTTGTGPWTHEFQSGSWTLPSMSIETGMPEVPPLRHVFRLRAGPDHLADAALGAADRDGAAGGAGRNGRHDHQRRNARCAGTEALWPFQRVDHPERHRPRQRGLGRDHLCQQSRPDRDHPVGRPHRRGRPVHRRFDGPDRGALRRPDAGDAGDRRRGLRNGIRLRPAVRRKLHLHRARRLPAAAPDRDLRSAGGAGHLRLAGRARQRGRADVHGDPRERCGDVFDADARPDERSPLA